MFRTWVLLIETVEGGWGLSGYVSGGNAPGTSESGSAVSELGLSLEKQTSFHDHVLHASKFRYSKRSSRLATNRSNPTSTLIVICVIDFWFSDIFTSNSFEISFGYRTKTNSL